MTIVLNHIIFFFLFTTLFSNVLSQSLGEKSFYGGLFYVTDYISSDNFYSIRKNEGDLAAVDSVFNKTMRFYKNDISETLLCLTFSTIPFYEIKVKIPLIGVTGVIPLPSPPRSKFNQRVKNMPRILFVDSPQTEFGDKDKLAHFFANAFLRYNFGVFNLSKFLGIFVEYIEEGFFVNGDFSMKDIIANHLGELFALALINNKNAKPGDIFKVYQLLYIK